MTDVKMSLTATKSILVAKLSLLSLSSRLRRSQVTTSATSWFPPPTKFNSVKKSGSALSCNKTYPISIPAVVKMTKKVSTMGPNLLRSKTMRLSNKKKKRRYPSLLLKMMPTSRIRERG